MKDFFERLMPALAADDGTNAGGSAPAEENKDTGKPEDDGNKAKEPEKKYTDADVDRILDKKFAAWQKKQEAAISEAQKLAAMDEKQKADYEKKQLEKELADLKREKTIAGLTNEARKILSNEGVKISDDLLNNLIGEDAETTSKQVNAFVSAYKEAVAAGVKEALKGSTPTKGTSGSKLTKSDILKVQDRAERQKLISQNLDLFRE